MTIAHLMEMLLGKVCAMEGKIGDGTPFRHTSIEQIAEFMKKYPQCGDKYGNEMVFSGFSGKVLHNKMFVGLISYQRLKHQTKEKVHGRARGPVQMLTRQPNEGRARDGGKNLSFVYNMFCYVIHHLLCAFIIGLRFVSLLY